MNLHVHLVNESELVVYPSRSERVSEGYKRGDLKQEKSKLPCIRNPELLQHSNYTNLIVPTADFRVRVSAVFNFSLLSAVLPLAVLASPVEFNLTAPALDLDKRSFDNVRLTWYDISVGVTACGKTYSNSDFVVALDSQQFGSGFPGPNCFKDIALTVNGKTVNAQIVDNCPGCPFGGLDLTEGLFEQFASTAVGVLSGSWDFI